MEDQNTNLTDELKVSHSQEQKGSPLNGFDCIVDEQILGFSVEMEDLLREERVYYIPYSSSQTHRNSPQTPMTPFSEYVTHFNTPLPVHSYMNSFRDSIRSFIGPQQGSWDTPSVLPSPAHSSVSSSVPEVLPSDPVTLSSSHITSSLPSPTVPSVSPSLASNLTSSSSSTHTLIPSFSSAQSEQEQSNLPHLDISKEAPRPLLQDLQKTNGQTHAEQSSVRLERQESRTQEIQQGASTRSAGNLTVETQSSLVSDAGESMANIRTTNENTTKEPALGTASDVYSNLINQLQPEVISNLVKIIKGVQKNMVHFYIHSADEESDVCWEIKVHSALS